MSARFDMCQFKPETTLNEATLARYAKVRLRVMRQVHFSTADQRSASTWCSSSTASRSRPLELKTDFTQSVDDAIDAVPKRPAAAGPTAAREPLLAFGHRALVHFAVSNDEV